MDKKNKKIQETMNNPYQCLKDSLFGKIPVGWKFVILSDYLEEVKERNTKRKEFPVFSVTNKTGFVLQIEYFSRAIHSVNTQHYKLVYKGNFAYNPARINVGSIALMKNYEVGLLSPMYVVFKTTNGLSSEFLEYYVQMPKFNNDVNNNTAGSVRESLNFSGFRLFSILIPEFFKEQISIASVLSTLDDAIEKTDQLIEKYKRIKQGLMKDLFRYGIDENGQIRSEKTHKFKDSSLGRIPEEWDFITLTKVTDKITDGEHFCPHFIDDGIPFVSAKDILQSGINFSNITYISLSDYKRMIQRCHPEYNDVLIVSRGATIGRVSIHKTNRKFALLGSVILIKSNHLLLNSEYLFYLISDRNYLQTLLSLSGSSAQQAIYIRDIQKIIIKFPSLFEQSRIASVLCASDEAIEKEQSYKEKLLALKRGLMEDLLTGKVRIPQDLIKEISDKS